MRRRLLLLRHGEVDYFPQGRPVPPGAVSLTPRGRTQAEAVGKLLREIPLDLAIHSGLPRTKETAEIVLKERNVPLEEWPELREIQPGRLRDLDDPERAFKEAFYPRRLTERFLGGETYEAFLNRVLPAYDHLLTRPWNTLLLVAHAGVIRAIISYALTGERRFLPFEVDPCGLSVLDIGDKVVLRALNILAHEGFPVNRLTAMELLWTQYQK